MIKFAIVLILLGLLYQDLKYRAVYWIFYPVLLALMVLLALKSKGYELLIADTIMNITFLSSQLIFLIIYISIKRRRLTNITNDYLGWGDVLFLFVLTFYPSPANYFAFYLSSLILILISSISTARQKPRTIPLAGLQAGLFAIVLVLDNNNNFLNDNWIFNSITG